jgi:hypothetical protein
MLGKWPDNAVGKRWSHERSLGFQVRRDTRLGVVLQDRNAASGR